MFIASLQWPVIFCCGYPKHKIIYLHFSKIKCNFASEIYNAQIGELN